MGFFRALDSSARALVAIVAVIAFALLAAWLSSFSTAKKENEQAKQVAKSAAKANAATAREYAAKEAKANAADARTSAAIQTYIERQRDETTFGPDARAVYFGLWLDALSSPER